MKITKPFVVIVTLICMSFAYVAMAQRVRPGPSISPRPDLTGATYCLFGQGTWLFGDPLVSVSVTANPFAARLDFTSSTQLTVTGIYDPVQHVFISGSVPPFLDLVDDGDDLGDPEAGTYTLVANLLTLTTTDGQETETISFIMTPDAQTFVGGFAQPGIDGTVKSWETGMVVGVRAANCDGLVEEEE